MAKRKEYVPTYTIGQLEEAAAPLFNTHAVVVRAALTYGGKSEYTIDEAKETVKYFTNREV